MPEGTCSVAGCERPQIARGYCKAHHARVQRNGEPGGPIPERRQLFVCSIDGCDRPHMGRGWCSMHYQRWKRRGDPLDDSTRWGGFTAAERIMAKVRMGPGCWEWQGTRNELGYGLTSAEGQRVRVHRFIYELLIGPIPDGLVLDHLCRNPPCCNPAHLEPVTQGENVRRGVVIPRRRERSANRTHCRRGHELTPENTYVVAKTGYRKCRKCNAAAHQRRKAQRGKP